MRDAAAFSAAMLPRMLNGFTTKRSCSACSAADRHDLRSAAHILAAAGCEALSRQVQGSRPLSKGRWLPAGGWQQQCTGVFEGSAWSEADLA